jgi:arylsulfatase A-like enzyme
VIVPPYWPDNEVSRNDVLDYYWKVERYDREVGELLELLRAAGKLDDTIVVMTGDNGWPFPRCKANLYDGGTRQPLAVRWPAKIKAGQVCDDFINLMDISPTFLEAAGVKAPREMTGRSFMGLLTGEEKPGARNTVFPERERHANVRAGNLGYPARAIRTREFLYIRNFRPDRWPAGDPEPYRDPYHRFGDCDEGPTKNWILDHRDQGERYFQLCFGKRPGEELYDLSKDPDEIKNVADDAGYASTKARLRRELAEWMKKTADPRASKDDDHWDTFPYFGGRAAADSK